MPNTKTPTIGNGLMQYGSTARDLKPEEQALINYFEGRLRAEEEKTKDLVSTACTSLEQATQRVLRAMTTRLDNMEAQAKKEPSLIVTFQVIEAIKKTPEHMQRALLKDVPWVREMLGENIKLKKQQGDS